MLHGGGTSGIESPFISQIIETIANSNISVLGFNMPYCERGEKETRMPELTEEVEALADVIGYLRGEGYQKINIVAKSLGGIIASFYLDKNPAEDIDVIILGYVIGSVKMGAVVPCLRLVIQGADDRFGDSQAVREELNNRDTKIVEIPQADHSYRNKDSEPAYQAEAIKILLANL